METRKPGSKRVQLKRRRPRKDTTMGLFRRKPRQASADRKPSRAERRAAERTAQAEASLTQTEQQIHRLADEVRRDLRSSGR
jgi:hypothetical protein